MSMYVAVRLVVQVTFVGSEAFVFSITRYQAATAPEDEGKTGRVSLTVPEATAPVVKHSLEAAHWNVVGETEKLAYSAGTMIATATPWVVVKDPFTTASVAELS
jgi:hypothetical protein